MAPSLSKKKNIGVSVSSPGRFRKKVFRVFEKTLIVIHPELVKSLRINEDTWIDEMETDTGISLTICNPSKEEKIIDEYSEL